jgi:D-glycero-alpha-D-manno-heptose-7-phosphate kinase
VEVVRASAPVRICDAGGWTDTWFAERGVVCALASAARVHVDVAPVEGPPGRVRIDAADLGLRYEVVPGRPRLALLEAAVEEGGVPSTTAVEVRVRSDVPPACSTGTSAAVTVAVLTALGAVAGRPFGPDAVAAAAHRVEVERLGLQSGVQDQAVAAHGGACWIDVDPYPATRVTPVDVPAWDELGARVVTVYLGSGHSSSALHEQVIAELVGEGATSPRLDALRASAALARDALVAGDLDAYGAALRANTDAQARLHPDLVGTDARRAIAVAAAHGASGWKVNGAGGEGGSLSVLAPADPERREALSAGLLAASPHYRLLPGGLSRAGARIDVVEVPAR